MLDPLRFIGAGELRDGDLTLEFLELAIHAYHKVPTYFFRMKTLPTGAEAGTVNLRVGSTPHLELYAGHIGYGVHEPYRGHRFAARSVVLLLPLAAELGLDPLWITCDPENIASRRSLEIAGAEFVEIVDVPEDCGIRKFGGKTRKCRFRLQISQIGTRRPMTTR
ncbi:MAG TPA: GNAT family N-acetyltransferase [Terracidiphilus sp.]|nr:GNAT family N-acetyltransferase [Terracidiphilus sp.]